MAKLNEKAVLYNRFIIKDRLGGGHQRWSYSFCQLNNLTCHQTSSNQHIHTILSYQQLVPVLHHTISIPCIASLHRSLSSHFFVAPAPFLMPPSHSLRFFVVPPQFFGFLCCTTISDGTVRIPHVSSSWHSISCTVSFSVTLTVVVPCLCLMVLSPFLSFLCRVATVPGDTVPILCVSLLYHPVSCACSVSVHHNITVRASQFKTKIMEERQAKVGGVAGWFT